MKNSELINRWFFPVLVAASFLAGCHSGDSQGNNFQGTHGINLNRCHSCRALENYIKQSAIEMLDQAYADPNGCYRLVKMPGEPQSEITPPTIPGAGQDATEGYSSTNIQEAGVDEPDFVKSDGQYVYLLNGGYFLIYAVAPPPEAHELSRIEVEGTPFQMFVTHDTAIIFSMPTTGPIVPADTATPEFYGLKITILDVSSKLTPQTVREMYVQGTYTTARLVEQMVHIVISSYLNLPSLNYGQGLSENVRAIEQSPLASLIPKEMDIIHQGSTGPGTMKPISACENFYLPESHDIHAILTILSFDLENPLEGPNEASILSPASISYASSKNIYVSHVDISPEDCRQHTIIHKFDVKSTPGQAMYRASGEVDGWLLNQFSMGEENEFLRVATTGGDTVWGGDSTMSNNLFVLEENEAALQIAGEIRGIAPGEKIYAARFLGDVGFMVTFVKIDPLFTFDLTDPHNPKQVGRLEVPGYSAYIHPADADHILTIGKDTDDNGNFAWFRGIQISIYNIVRLDTPELTDMEIIGTRGTSSEALDDHKAFNYFSPKGILAFPIELYEGGGQGPEYGQLTFVGFLVYGVDLSQGFTLLGQISHDDLYARNPDCYSKQMRRTIIIGDSVCTISNAGMKINALTDLSDVQTSIRFPTCDGYPFPNLKGGAR